MTDFITHAGTFHADEVFATAILRIIFDRPGLEHRILRVRDASCAKPEDIVYDIGGGELDHHQAGGAGCRPNGVPYAACGKVWAKYGPMLRYGDGRRLTPKQIDAVDRRLIQGIDARDCGYTLRSDPACAPCDVSSVIALFNPAWNDPQDEDAVMARFMLAVAAAEQILRNVIHETFALADAEALVEEAIGRSEDGIMVLDQYCPWEEHLLKSEQPMASEILYVIYPSNRGGWNWQAAPVELGSYAQRRYVPRAWRGARAETLRQLTGVDDAIFCHPAGFIGGAESLEGAIKIARLAVETGANSDEE